MPDSYIEDAEVSIHTPTKGVTTELGSGGSIVTVSIHTPTKGVTFCNGTLFIRQAVSIHTPTKGVTFANVSKSAYELFQSTHPRRV